MVQIIQASETAQRDTSVSQQSDRTSRPWHPSDPIVEPLGVYRLPNGQLVLSREYGE